MKYEPYTRDELIDLLADALEYITPTLSTHEEITEVLQEERGFWCPCGYCPKKPPDAAE